MTNDIGLSSSQQKALNVLGAEEGLVLAQQQGIAVYFLVKTATGFSEQYTPSFKAYLLERKMP